MLELRVILVDHDLKSYLCARHCLDLGQVRGQRVKRTKATAFRLNDREDFPRLLRCVGKGKADWGRPGRRVNDDNIIVNREESAVALQE